MIATVGIGIVVVLAFLSGVFSFLCLIGLVVSIVRRSPLDKQEAPLQAFVCVICGLLSWCLFEVVLLAQAVR